MTFKFDKQKIKKKYESFSLEEVYEERNVNALGIESVCRLRNKCERSGYDRTRNLLI